MRLSSNIARSTTRALLTAALLCSPLLVQGQNLPPELKRKRSSGIDPTLPELLRPAVTRAIKAELDPKRGTGNALQILRAERKKYEKVPETRLSLELRIAAVVLRTRFIHNQKVEKPRRFQQALSTFSKLEITDPGLKEWLTQTLNNNPKAKKSLKARKGILPLKVGILTRGSGLKRKVFLAALQKKLSTAGLRVRRVPVKKADYLFKVSSDEIRRPNKTPAVRITMVVESRNKKVAPWRQSYYRTSESNSLSDAVDSNIDWLIRTSGRDVLFHWLAGHGLNDVIMRMPGGDKHDHHGHSKQRRLRPSPHGANHEPPPPTLRK